MTSRETLKAKIDHVSEEHLDLLEEILKAFQTVQVEKTSNDKPKKKLEGTEWRAFLEKFAGCISGAPIQRGSQGEFENREKIL
jgi:hypothetical protein